MGPNNSFIKKCRIAVFLICLVLVTVLTTGALSDLANRPRPVAYGKTDAYSYATVSTFAQLNTLSFAASTGRMVVVANDEKYHDTDSWYMVWADNRGVMHVKHIFTETAK